MDGQSVGRVSATGRLSLDLSAGQHQLRAHLGRTTSANLSVDLSDDATTIVAVRPSPGNGELLLQLVVTDGFDDRGPRLRDAYFEARRNRPPIGYRRRSRREQICWVAAVALLILGQVLARTANAEVGVMVSLPGMVAVVVLFFRVFWYKPRSGPSSR